MSEEVQIPNLPGYISNDKCKKNHAKRHIFDVIDGMKVTDIGHDMEIKPSETSTVPHDNIFYDKTQQQDFQVPDHASALKRIQATVNKLPKWIMFDKAVLRFWAWTKEPVMFSNQESERVRYFRIFYYLDDDTIHISEERGENSGIEQGLFVKRQSIPHATEDRYIKYSDIKVQEVITVFAQKFNVFKVDEFTREFYSKMSLPLEEDIEPPMDTYCLARDVANEHPAPDTTISSYRETLLGKPSSWQFEREKKFLTNDRKVLRFWATWSDPQIYGKKHFYLLLYYLADDTISVHELYPENAGTILFPTFLARKKLPKEAVDHGVALIGEDITDLKEGDCYTDADLRVGGYVTVFGRHMLLTRADAYTMYYYIDMFGLQEADFEPIVESNRESKPPKVTPAPYSGFGTEEDSLASVKHLIPRVPPKDYVKILRYDTVVMRFSACLETERPEDIDRRFVIEFYRSDDTVKIYETRRPNAGFMGGKFLERRKLKNVETGDNFKPEEFFCGAVLTINGFKFKLLEADESTMNHMESEKSNFKFANADAILRKLAMILWNRRQSRTETFRFIDSNHDHFIDHREFENMMKTYGWTLNQHEILTLWRHYDTNGDGKITASEFLQTLEKYFHGNK